MRTAFFGVAAAIGLMGAGANAASAADMMPVKAPPPAGFDWSGMYIGGHIGGGWQTADFQGPSTTTNILLCCTLIGNVGGGVTVPETTTSGFLGGGQIGWSYQIGRLVVGSDFDISGIDLTSSASGILPGPLLASPAVATEAFTAKTDWTATATATVGLARDRWLLYTKAGIAWAHENYSLGLFGVTSGFGPALPFSFSATTGDTRIGWTVGTGIAWAFAGNWSARLEYDYLNFGSKPENFTAVIVNANGNGGPLTSPFTFNTSNYLQMSEVKLGLNYKFQPGFLFW